jgi:AAHS family 4-hydroxybenzoate transporter-like MFS transporter
MAKSQRRPQTQAPTVGDIMEQRSPGAFQIRTIALCGLVLIVDGFDAQTIGLTATAVAATTGLPVSSFGPIFSASLFGLMIAAMISGPIADRWGRKWPVIISTLALGAFSFLTGRATTFNELVILRFLTGLGLGGAMPNVVALASEYLPKRLVPIFVPVLFAGVPLGALFCGLVSSLLLADFGWPAVFYVGGVLPFAIAVALIFFLPESVQFLALRGKDTEKIRSLVRRIAPEAAASEIRISSAATEHQGVPVKRLFTERRAAGTLALWFLNFMNLLLMYVIVNWLPALLTAAGMSVAAGVMANTFYSFGGVFGSLLEGTIIRAFGSYRTLLVQFGLCSLLVCSLALLAGNFGLVMGVALCLGLLVVGEQAGLNVLATQYYPTSLRSTGLGYTLGVGRIGSIVGPLMAGALLSGGWKAQQVMMAGAIPAGCAFLAILLSRRISGLGIHDAGREAA